MVQIKRQYNTLTNLALSVFALMVCAGIAEYALRNMTFEGLSGQKMYLGEVGSQFNIALKPYAVVEGKIFEYDQGNCYPSDSTGYLPLKVINPYDGKYWHCVLYDKKLRHMGYNPDRNRQMAIVGDSFVFGQGVKESDTLGYQLNEHYPKINFQNWGRLNASIADVTQRCKEIIVSKPSVDEVIYFYNLNDVRMSGKVRSSQEDIIDFQNIRWSNDEQRRSPLVKLLSKSALFSFIRKVCVIRWESFLTTQNYRDMYLSEDNRKEFLSTMDDIRSFRDMLAAHGISFRVVIYPLLHKDLLGRYPFKPIHQVIMSECEKRGVACLDGYEPFKDYYSMKRFAVHPLDYHPNGLSNRLLVEYIHKNNFITNSGAVDLERNPVREAQEK
jgi:hypothetical protein